MKLLTEPYREVLDTADTIFAANYLLGYFGSADDAPHLMRLQKIEELKAKKLWDINQSFNNSFATSTVIDPNNPDFGINVYAVGSAVDGRRKKPEYERLLELTTTHSVNGGWGCYDLVVTLTTKHKSIRLEESQVPTDEFVLGFIRLDAGVLNNAPLQNHLDISQCMCNFDIFYNHLYFTKKIADKN